MIENVVQLYVIAEYSILIFSAAMHEIEDIVLLALVIAVREINIKAVLSVDPAVALLYYPACEQLLR